MDLHPQFRTQNGDVFLFKFLSFLIIGMVHSYYLKFMWTDRELHKLSKNDPTFLLEVAIFSTTELEFMSFVFFSASTYSSLINVTSTLSSKLRKNIRPETS